MIKMFRLFTSEITVLAATQNTHTQTRTHCTFVTLSLCMKSRDSSLEKALKYYKTEHKNIADPILRFDWKRILLHKTACEAQC